ncbi:fatty acid desaturase [Actinoplanes sp. ATCC 53533]|uniref:fatty acid desaturase family protein n=1 Tax=Actinoplanes sp. ATCC 53533 TaxID=1288362 RepID=UPI000F77F9E2|nr:fatty acid desaturase [Actinoplanes sp. ATCC 53533]RSM58020.1 fatty acid desaturase [Actinoplanes sp. ATCC 53533]
MIEREPRRLWRNSPADAILLGLCIAQFAVTIALAALTPAGLWPRLGSAVLVTAMITYSVLIVNHMFVHQPWFNDARLNGIVSLVMSANIAQSAQAYHLSHVRNHHRYNNDRKRDGTTADFSSTYRYSRDDDHAPLWRYLAYSLVASIQEFAVTWASLRRLGGVGPRETTLRGLASRNPGRRAAELGQLRYDRLAQVAFTVLLAVLSWQWVLLCYLPSVAIAFTLVNVQNYYRHFGAEPDSRYANSVSYYSRLYNRLTFNDGYHQEHHLRPTAHWTRLREVAAQYQERLDEAGRVVSPVPPVVGFLDTGRIDRVAQRSSATRPTR